MSKFHSTKDGLRSTPVDTVNTIEAEMKAFEFLKSRIPIKTELFAAMEAKRCNDGFNFRIKARLNSKIVTINVGVSQCGEIVSWKFPEDEDFYL